MNYTEKINKTPSSLDGESTIQSQTIEPVQEQTKALPKRYHPLLVAIHWTVVILVGLNLFIGIILFPNVSSRTLTGFHMAIGIAALVIMTARIFVRIFTPRPARASTGNKWLDLAGELTHYALYALVIILTVFGILFASETGVLQIILLKMQPASGGILGRMDLFGIPLMTYHKWAAYALAALLSLHIGAAVSSVHPERPSAFQNVVSLKMTA